MQGLTIWDLKRLLSPKPETSKGLGFKGLGVRV